MNKVVFVYAGDKGRPHPVHGKFASSVTDVFIDHKLGTNLPGLVDVLLRANHLPESDIYLTENSAYLPVALSKKFGEESKLVTYFSNPVYEINISHSYLYSLPYQIMLRALLSRIDGVITASEYMKDLLQPYTDVPIEVAEPFIENQRFKKYGKITPNLSSKKIISVGRARPHKGLNILEKAFEIIRVDHPTAELYLIGKGTQNRNSSKNVHALGYVEDLVPYLENSSLTVRSSHHEGFCVASLEAMRAGIPAIVTEGCGEKELVRKIRDDFVCPTNAKELAKQIKHYFNLTKGDKKKLSKNFRVATEPYQEEKKTLKFKRKFKKILRRINYA